MSIYSDKISEIYRKYVIGLKLDGNIFYILFCTDSQNLDHDFLAIHRDNSIICADNIIKLKNDLKKEIDFQKDKISISNWLKLHRSIKPYNMYDLDLLKSILSEKTLIEKMSNKKKMLILNFINLFTDYILQIENKEFEKIRNSKTIRGIFFEISADFINIDLQDQIDKYKSKNENNRKEKLKSMLNFFISKLGGVEV